MTESSQASGANPMWGGHYRSQPDALMQQINASIAVDQALWPYDIAGSRAHVTMLAACGILTEAERDRLLEGLAQVEAELREGALAFTPALEDIHMHIEARLHALIGEEVAGKLHTARSRNDQVATDFRLYVRDACHAAVEALRQLVQSLLARAEAHVATIMPGLTHLQVAQPVTLGHHLLAYAEMLLRDISRFRNAGARLNECPLGAAALAGTSFAIDRAMTARALGFARPCRNSLDAVAARDFATDYLAAAAQCLTHLSRLAEELVLWSSSFAGFITLPEALTTGSSIMPQKRNPDAAELVRAKAARVSGHLQHMLGLMKALPLAYNKDLQEDKAPVFDTAAALALCLPVMAAMLEGMMVHPQAMHRAAAQRFSTATDLADWLVRHLGLPFRRAHRITGELVRLAESAGCGLEALPLSEMQAVEPSITAEIYEVLTVEASVHSRTSIGGTAPERVREAITALRKALAAPEEGTLDQ